MQLASGWTSVSPSRDQAIGTSGSTTWRQSNGLNIWVQGGSLAQFNQHDVAIKSIAVVTGMSDDRLRVDELLSVLSDINVMLAQTHLDTTEHRDRCEHLLDRKHSCIFIESKEVCVSRLELKKLHCIIATNWTSTWHIHICDN